MTIRYPYQVGGTLPLESPFYIHRSADDEIVHAILKHKLCAVFAPHQTGKSSLRLQTAARLTQQGYRCVNLYATQLLDSPKDRYRWDKLLVSNLWDGLFPKDSAPLTWWLRQTDYLLPQQRLEHFVRDLLFKQLSEQPIVVFIDAAEALLDTPFLAEEISDWLLHCYSLREIYPIVTNLQFVILGATSPTKLIKSESLLQSTQLVSLAPIQASHAEPLTAGFATQIKSPKTLLDIIFRWSGGHPLLTQKLCQLVSAQLDALGISSHQDAFVEGLNQWVDDLVATNIIESWYQQDDLTHLWAICHQLRQSKYKNDLISLWHRLLLDSPVELDGSHIQSELCLLGLARPQDNYLTIDNEIYRHIFAHIF